MLEISGGQSLDSSRSDSDDWMKTSCKQVEQWLVILRFKRVTAILHKLVLTDRGQALPHDRSGVVPSSLRIRDDRCSCLQPTGQYYSAQLKEDNRSALDTPIRTSILRDHEFDRDMNMYIVARSEGDSWDLLSWWWWWSGFEKYFAQWATADTTCRIDQLTSSTSPLFSAVVIKR